MYCDRGRRRPKRFATVRASDSNHFGTDQNLTSRAIFNKNRAAALVEWRGLCARWRRDNKVLLLMVGAPCAYAASTCLPDVR